jgi:hypothetical protein
MKVWILVVCVLILLCVCVCACVYREGYESGRIVCSLTTIPQRYELLPTTIDSLQAQTVQPSTIYIHVAPKTMKGEPQDVEKLKRIVSRYPNVVVNVIEKDLGPITKVIPVLPLIRDDDKVVLVDDDVKYKPDMIEGLKKSGGPAVGYAGRRANLEFITCLGVKSLTDVDFIETFAGAMYDGKVLRGLPEYNSTLGDLCSMQDDIKIGNFLKLGGVPRVVIPFKSFCEHDAKDTPQLRDGNLGSGNSACFKKLYY